MPLGDRSIQLERQLPLRQAVRRPLKKDKRLRTECLHLQVHCLEAPDLEAMLQTF